MIKQNSKKYRYNKLIGNIVNFKLLINFLFLQFLVKRIQTIFCIVEIMIFCMLDIVTSSISACLFDYFRVNTEMYQQGKHYEKGYSASRLSGMWTTYTQNYLFLGTHWRPEK